MICKIDTYSYSYIILCSWPVGKFSRIAFRTLLQWHSIDTRTKSAYFIGNEIDIKMVPQKV